MPEHRTVPLTLATAVLLTGCAAWRGHPQVSGNVDDAAITARVRQALVKDTAVRASEVDVHTSQGRVLLNGVVDNAAMARRAEQVAERTPGVRSVNNALQIVNPRAPGVAGD